jgi:hypothetical protein
MSEAVLEILYKYRKSGFSEVVLVLLDHYLEAATEEPTLLEYILNS